MKKNFLRRAAAIISTVALSISVPMVADYYNIAAADNNIATPTDAIQNEFTTAPITLKVGDILKLTSTTIDPLISEEAVNLNSSVMHVYFAESDSAVYDTSYLTSTYAYSFLDPETFAPVYEGYATETEMSELWNKKSAGTLEYDGKKVTLSNSVAPYYLRAEKSGSFTITIPEYAIGSDENVTTMKVNIPVVIESNTITSSTDSTITINAGNFLSVGTSLTTAKLESGNIYDTAKKLVTDKLENVVKYAVYELNLTATDNSEIHELAGKVKVTMNVPFEMSDGSTLKVFRVDGDILTECASTITNGKVTFETDHFSTYILAEQNTNSAPDTGDMNNICLYIILMGVCTAAIAILTYIKRVKA